MKKIVYFLSILCMLFTMFGMTVFARDIQLDDENSAEEVLVTISASVPDSFDERIEVYLNGSPHPLTRDYQYTMELPLERNVVYDVVILSSTDVEDRYEFTAPSTLSPATEQNLTIQVMELYKEIPGSNISMEFEEEIVEIDDLDLTPSQYNFSNGQESGTVHISMKDYGVFDTVTYRLVGEEVYDIVLDSEHYFQADVILPIGSYYESATMEYTLHDWVPDTDLSFALEHVGNIGNFGKYYDVTAGSKVNIDDLIIYMIQGSNSMEVNADIINDSVVVEQSLEIQQEHERKELESAFPELAKTPAETETIATAQEIEEVPFDLINLLFVIGGVICGFGIGLLIYYFIRKKRQ